VAIHRAHLTALFLCIFSCLLASCTKPEAPHSTLASATIPQRVVVIGPGTAANIFALGAGHLVVGVSDYNTVAAAADLPRVGGLFDPNHERIAALNPDLLIVQGQAQKLESFCASMGIEFRSFSTDTIAAWQTEMEWLAQRLGAQAQLPQQREQLIQGLQELGAAQKAKRLKEGSAGQNPAPTAPPRVLLVISRRADEASSIIVAGSSSFLNELLTYAGGANVFPEAGRDYFDLNEESLIRAAPDVILEFGTDPATALPVWRASFPQVPAVRDDRVKVITNMDALMPGPSMLETARSIAAMLADS
jgi:iron complex transport system substrate-binding protein